MRPGAGASLWNSASATSAAAPPPTPLNSATICGIAVIFTRRAATAPNAPPIARADDDQPGDVHARLQRASRRSRPPCPTAPIQLPRRAVAGDERNRSARMKQTIVTR